MLQKIVGSFYSTYKELKLHIKNEGIGGLDSFYSTYKELKHHKNNNTAKG